MLDSIELYKRNSVEDSLGGVNVDSYNKVGTVAANVEEYSGSRMEWFKSIGYTKPVTIRIFVTPIEFDIVKWGDVSITIKSRLVDGNNTLMEVITGDITTVRI